MTGVLVSCVVPVFNGERYLGEALESILAQSYEPIEIIVVDDGSIDGTPTVARSFGTRVRYLRHSTAGPSATRNRGIAAATAPSWRSWRPTICGIRTSSRSRWPSSTPGPRPTCARRTPGTSGYPSSPRVGARSRPPTLARGARLHRECHRREASALRPGGPLRHLPDLHGAHRLADASHRRSCGGRAPAGRAHLPSHAPLESHATGGRRVPGGVPPRVEHVVDPSPPRRQDRAPAPSADRACGVDDTAESAVVRSLFLIQQFWPYVGGLEVWASRLLPGLIERGHEISVVTSHAALRLPDRDRYKGMEILRLPLRAALESNDVRALVTMRRAVADLKRAFAPDLIHVNLTGPIASFQPLTAEASDPRDPGHAGRPTGRARRGSRVRVRASPAPRLLGHGLLDVRAGWRAPDRPRDRVALLPDPPGLRRPCPPPGPAPGRPTPAPLRRPDHRRQGLRPRDPRVRADPRAPSAHSPDDRERWPRAPKSRAARAGARCRRRHRLPGLGRVRPDAGPAELRHRRPRALPNR